MHLGNDGYVGSALGGFDRRAHTGQTAANDDDIVLDNFSGTSGEDVRP